MASTGASKMTMVSRNKVFWFGQKDKHDEVAEFERRNLSIAFSDEFNCNELLAIRGIVFRYNRLKHNQSKNLLKKIIDTVFDYGVFLYLIADDDEAVMRIRQILEFDANAKIDVPLTIRVSPHLYEVAETIARHDPGPAPNLALRIEPNTYTKTLDDKSQLLLKRCFHDCSSILLKPLTEGRSTARVFSVHAVFADAVAGPRPLPFFVKIDTKHRIERERKNYEAYTFHFIPFSLRPNIEPDRCVNGKMEGVLVGNFVENSESLWDVLRRGNGQQVIYSLFDNALRGWRMQANKYKNNFAYAMSSNPQEVGDFFNPMRVSPERFQDAKELGATKNPNELKEILISLPPIMIRHSPIHADLHANNVRVRGADPILIDFASTRTGPKLADPASLEVSLAFGVTGEDDDDSSWTSLVDKLYDFDFLNTTPDAPLEPLPREWLWASIRQIRLIALADQVSPHEYRLSLVTYLLRTSMHSRETEKENYRFTYAYCLAEKMLLKIEKKLKIKKL